MKNINMSERKAPEVTNKGGMQIRAINPDSGRGLKIRSKEKIILKKKKKMAVDATPGFDLQPSASRVPLQQTTLPTLTS